MTHTYATLQISVAAFNEMVIIYLTSLILTGYAWGDVTGRPPEVRLRGVGIARDDTPKPICVLLSVDQLSHPIQSGSHGDVHLVSSLVGALGADGRRISTLDRRSSTLDRSSNSSPSHNKVALYKPDLDLHISPLEKYQKRYHSVDYGSSSTNPDQPPFVRRLILAVCGAVMLIPACYYGDFFIRRHRRRLGWGLVGVSFFIFWAGLILMFLGGFRWTWNWWL